MVWCVFRWQCAQLEHRGKNLPETDLSEAWEAVVWSERPGASRGSQTGAGK